MPSSVRSALLGALALLGLLVLANFNVVFERQSLVASANYHPFDDRFTHLKPGTVRGPAFVNWHDEGATWWQWEPAAQFFSKAFRRLELPLWDPTIAGGVDAHTQLTSGQYFPPYVVLLLAGNTTAERDAYYLLEALAAGLGMFLLLSRNGLRQSASIAAAFAFMVGGTITQNINSVMGQSYAMLPFFVLAADWLVERPTMRRIGAAALILATCTLSSFLPIVVSGFLLAGLFFLTAWLRPLPLVPREHGTGERGRLFVACGAAVVLGVLVTAFLLWPVHLMQVQGRLFRDWYKGAGLIAFTPGLALSLVSPSIGYDTLQTIDPSKHLFPLPNPATSHFFYIGLVPILLACLAKPGRTPRARRLFWFFLLSTTVLALKDFGVPPLQWLGDLPVFSTLHFVPYFAGALAFAVCGLAGCGVDAIVDRVPVRDLVVVPLAIIGFLALVLLFAATHPVNPGMAPAVLARAVFEMGAVVAWLVLLGAALVGLLVWRRANGRAGIVALFVIALIALELVPTGERGRYGRVDVWRSPPEYVAALQQDHTLFRVHGVFDLALTPNVSEGLGLSDIGSRMIFNSDRYTALIKSSFAMPDLPYPLPTDLIPRPRVMLDLLNVKYLITHGLRQERLDAITAQGFVEWNDDGNFVVFRNPTVWPRAYFTRQFTVAPTPEAALAAVRAIQPGTVVLEQAPSPAIAPAADATGSEIASIDYHDNTVTISVTADRPGLVVLTDTDEPGWRAFVNGRETPILLANYAFRAVEVPGTATVVFTYRTPGLMAGLATSGLALVTIAGLVLVPVRRRHA